MTDSTPATAAAALREPFARFDPITDPRRRRSLYEPLSGDLGALDRIVQGIMIHVYWTAQYDYKPPAERMAELQIRAVHQKLDRITELDPRPLTEARSPERKLLGTCRDHTVLLVSLLQHQGIPARARCGFATYFKPGWFVDHWVCEYWNESENRWKLVDAQLDAIQRRVLGIDFDPLDVPRNRFVVAGEAWRSCRLGQADPDRFGIFELKGLWFIRGNVLRDAAALNGMALLPWDTWGLMQMPEEKLGAGELGILDQLGGLITGDVPDIQALQSLYRGNADLGVPSSITSYVDGQPREIDLSTDLGAEG